MIPQEVAHVFGAHRSGDGQWRGKCPAHNGQSHNSLSIQASNDGKTLLKCWGGCPTDEVLNSAGLEWKDLFPPSASTKLISKNSSSSSSSKRISDPKVALQQRAEHGLRDWKEKTGRAVHDRVWRQYRLITEGESLITNGRPNRGWEFLQLGYEGLSRLEWLADLIDSKHPQDWLTARMILKGTPS